MLTIEMSIPHRLRPAGSELILYSEFSSRCVSFHSSPLRLIESQVPSKLAAIQGNYEHGKGSSGASIPRSPSHAATTSNLSAELIPEHPSLESASSAARAQ